MRSCYTKSITGKTQANGAQEINVVDSLEMSREAKKFWQIQIVPSATPSTGTMTIAVKTPGASAYTTLTTTIDMTGTELLATFEAAAESIKLTPTSFDADKTYSAYLCAI